jgi:hypothetical protein
MDLLQRLPRNPNADPVEPGASSVPKNTTSPDELRLQKE